MKITHVYTAVVALTAAAVPSLGHAADPTLQGLIVGTNDFVNSILVPAVLAVAFLMIVINVVRYFVIGGANEEGQNKAKTLALYSTGAFVFILTFWGIVNLITNGIGLNDDPCNPTSDYISPDGTSCGQPANVSIDTSGFGNDIPAFAPPGGTVGPRDPVGPDVTLPGDYSGPTMPPAPGGPIISFDPDGNPFGDTLVSQDAARRALQSGIQNYLATENANHFNHNAAVTTALFNTVIQPTSTDNPAYEQAAVAYRLNQLGAISQTELTNFIAAINAHDAAVGTPRPPLTMSTLAGQSLPLSSAAQNNIINTQGLIVDEINAYNARVRDTSPTSQVDVVEIMNDLYDESVSITARRARLDALFDNPGGQILTDEDSMIYDRFNDDLNLEAVFTHRFNEIEGL